MSDPAYKAFTKRDIDAVLNLAEDLINEELNSINNSLSQNSLKEMHNSNLEEAKVESDPTQKKV